MTKIDDLRHKFAHKPMSVVGLGGGERAFVDEALDFLRKKMLSPESSAFNHSHLQGGESDLSYLLADLATVPFLAPYRLIELHAAEKLDEKTAALLITYLENPFDTSVLVVVFNKIDKRNKLINSLMNKGYFYVFDSVGDQDLINIIAHEAKKNNMALSKEAAQFLMVSLDSDLLAIKSVLNKLALVYEGGAELAINDIEAQVGTSGEPDIFLLARTISEGKLADSLFTLGVVRNNQENALKFLGVLIWQFRVLVEIRDGFDRGMSESEIAKRVSVYGERFRAMAAIARKKTSVFHINRLTRLLECDAALKSINTKEPFNLIEKVVYQSAAGL